MVLGLMVLGGKLPNTGELFPRQENPSGNLLLQPVNDLGVDWTGIPIVQMYHRIPPNCTSCSSTVSIAMEQQVVKVGNV